MMSRPVPIESAPWPARQRTRRLLPGSVVVLGRFEGTLWAEGDVVIGRTGYVTGGVKGRHLCIQGRSEGKLHADRVVLIQGRAVVAGELSGRILVAEPGAVVRGRCVFGQGGATEREVALAAKAA